MSIENPMVLKYFYLEIELSEEIAHWLPKNGYSFSSGIIFWSDLMSAAIFTFYEA
jgi:hypothetical protein